MKKLMGILYYVVISVITAFAAVMTVECVINHIK